MKALKIILIILAGIVVIGFVGIAFLPGERTIDRSIVVNTSADKPFKLVNELTNWKLWSPWYMMDTTQVMTFSEKTEGEGAWYTWDSKNKQLMKGKLTVVHSSKPDSVIVNLMFGEVDGGNAGYYFEKVGENETRVSQRMHLVADGYLAKGQIFIMEMFMNPIFDQGLANIKSKAETMPDEPAKIGRIENLGESEMPALMYLGYTDTASIDQLDDFFKLAYGEIMVKAGMQNLEQAGPGLARYFHWDPENNMTVVQCGIQVNKEGKTDGNVEFVKLEAQKVIAADYFGPYEGVGSVHEAIYAYMDEHQIESTHQPFEFYMNDPANTPPDMLHTRICYPVK